MGSKLRQMLRSGVGRSLRVGRDPRCIKPSKQSGTWGLSSEVGRWGRTHTREMTSDRTQGLVRAPGTPEEKLAPKMEKAQQGVRAQGSGREGHVSLGTEQLAT